MTDRAQLFAQFKENILSLPLPVDDGVSDVWKAKCATLVENVKTKNLEEVLIWNNDFDMEELPVFEHWYREIELVDQGRLKALARKSTVLPAHRFAKDERCSPVSIQHAYHLKKYEDAMGERFIDGVDVVVEVGGGYGNFARILRRDGFSGLHVIIDLPHVLEVQKLFLNLNSIPVGDSANFSLGDSVWLIENETESLISLLSANTNLRTAFVSTWGLSETPLVFRNKLFPGLFERCTKYLIASQWTYEWRGIRNDHYFESFGLDGFDRKLLPVPHFETESYVFGRRKREAERARLACPTGSPGTPGPDGVFPDLQVLQQAIDRHPKPERIALRERSLPWGNGYGTHIPLLAATVAIARPGLILELGAGYFSTPLLRVMCQAMGRDHLTLETDKSWAAFDPEIEIVEDWSALKLLQSGEISVAFVDTTWHRVEAVRALANKCEFIVVHDTFNENYMPGMEDLLSTFKHRTDYVYLCPATSVVSNVRRLSL